MIRTLPRLLTLLSIALFAASTPARAERPPNIVVIFLDDSGWADFKPFGDPSYETPNVERLAAEGTRFDNVYVPQAICSASRAALLSGTVPGRNKVFGAHGPFGRGLTPDIKILSELLKPQGYATGHFGKWHIGDQPETRPLARGFDEHAGLMYSNDMWRFHPGNPEHWGKHPLQFWDNGEVTIEDMDKPDQTLLTVWATENSVDFIDRHHDEPFFLYLAHSMPHVPLFVSDRFAGKSGMGLYGDVMMELDWSVGEVMKALEAHNLADDTIVIFTSDNGPWVSYGNHAGATPFRDAKATGFDGGLRSATVVRYPPAVPAGHRSTTMFGTIDFMPTLARLAGADLPDHEIDGRDIWPILTSQALATNPHRYYPFSTSKEFEGIISGDGRWKLHLPHSYRHLIKAGNDGVDGTYGTWEIGLSLFDLKADPNELVNLIDEEPTIAAELISWAETHRDRFYPKSPNQSPVSMSDTTTHPPSLHKSVLVPTSRAEVWRAWTDQASLATWFGSAARVDLRVGGPYEILFLMENPPGQQGGEGNTIQSFTPEQSLTFTWNAPPDFGALRSERTQVRIELVDAPTGTTVSLTHDGWGQGPEWKTIHDYFDRAWDHVLAALTTHLSSP